MLQTEEIDIKQLMSESPLRRILTLGVIVAAAYVGWHYTGQDYVAMIHRPSQEEQLRCYREALAKPQTLVVVHHHQPSKISQRMARDLAQLDREKYGEEVSFVTMDVGTLPTEEERAGIRLSDDSAALSFYYEKHWITSIQGDLSKQQMDDKIDEVSRGLIRRMHKGWLPDVPGMKPRHNPASAYWQEETPRLSVSFHGAYSPAHEEVDPLGWNGLPAVVFLREAQGSGQWREKLGRTGEGESG